MTPGLENPPDSERLEKASLEFSQEKAQSRKVPTGEKGPESRHFALAGRGRRAKRCEMPTSAKLETRCPGFNWASLTGAPAQAGVTGLAAGMAERGFSTWIIQPAPQQDSDP